MAQTGTLRILTSVPQSSLPFISVGMAADVTFNEFPGRKWDNGRVVRMSNSLEPSARTMLVEVHLQNRDGKLYPGMYADVHFTLDRSNPPLLVPGESIIAGNTGLQVAVLRDSVVHLQPVVTGRDYGTETEIVNGLEAGDLIVVGPGDDVREGVTVKAEVTSPGRGTGANKK